MDFVLLMLMAVAVTLSFTEESLIAPLLQNRVVYWLGQFSFPLFLSQSCWCVALGTILPGRDYGELMPIYLVLVTVTGLVVYGCSQLIRRNRSAIRQMAADVFLEKKERC